MIISHKYKYLFIQAPLTASSVTGKELCLHYDGHPILGKHSNYRQFLKTATEEEKTFFTFGGLRNPLNVAVTYYFRMRDDHRNNYTDPRFGFVSKRDRQVSKITREQGLDFESYLLRFWWYPYDNRHASSLNKFDFIIRYENIESDFSEALRRIGVEQVRPLPRGGKTLNRVEDFYTYYKTPEIRAHAVRIFGPYMKKWGYEFPADWEQKPTWLDDMKFKACNVLREKFLWRRSRLSRRVMRLTGR